MFPLSSTVEFTAGTELALAAVLNSMVDDSGSITATPS